MNVQATVMPIDLGRWDSARPGDLVIVPVWSDVRPLRGAAGLLDWRMCGRLSALMLAGHVTGAEGEQLLLPSGARLVWRLILALGAGPRSELSEKRWRALVRRALKSMRGLGVTRAALALPARDGDPSAATTPSARRALDLAMGELEAHKDVISELTFLVPPATQKELGEAIRVRASRS